MALTLQLTYDGSVHSPPEDILRVLSNERTTIYLYQREEGIALFVVVKFTKSMSSLTEILDAVLLSDSAETATQKETARKTHYALDAIRRFFDLDGSTVMTEVLKEIKEVDHITIYFEWPVAYSMLIEALTTNPRGRELVLPSLFRSRLFLEYVLPIQRHTEQEWKWNVVVCRPVHAFPFGKDLGVPPYIEAFDKSCRQTLEG